MSGRQWGKTPRKGLNTGSKPDWHGQAEALFRGRTADGRQEVVANRHGKTGLRQPPQFRLADLIFVY